ncbi:MAG: sigma-70 family RNA polymerase sigma factor [Rikenellaceae bacterium]
MKVSEIEEIFKSNYKSLTLLVHRMVGCVDIAEDIVQETFVKLINKKDSLPRVSKAYLVAMVRNAAVDYLRSQNSNIVEVNGATLDASVTEEAYDSAHVKELEYVKNVSQLYQAIESLPPKSKQVFKMISIERHSYAHTAMVLGMSEGTVKTHMYRAMLFLRKYFAERHIEYA